MVETPVLYITFARPEYASQSFAAIKKAQPKKLYFYSNKARTDRPDEVARNEEVRSYVKQIDWDCEVKTWFREEYVDVFTSIWGAIDWIFDNEESACVIEEDVVASLAFFDYIDKLIPQYSNNGKVWIISGNNGAPKYNPANCSYFFSHNMDIYGWASWRRVWKSLDKNMSEWPLKRKQKTLKKVWHSNIIAYWHKYIFNKIYKQIDKYNPWDGIFMYNMEHKNGYCITPLENLCSDRGVAGANHNMQDKSLFYDVHTKKPFYDITIPPLKIESTSFDKKYVINVRLKDAVVRNVKRVLFTKLYKK